MNGLHIFSSSTFAPHFYSLVGVFGSGETEMTWTFQERGALSDRDKSSISCRPVKPGHQTRSLGYGNLSSSLARIPRQEYFFRRGHYPLKGFRNSYPWTRPARALPKLAQPTLSRIVVVFVAEVNSGEIRHQGTTNSL